MLNVRPALGRLIARGDEPRVGESAVAVLTYEFWQRGFGGDPNVVGKTAHGQRSGARDRRRRAGGLQGTNMGVRMDVFVPLTMAPVVDSGLTGRDVREPGRLLALSLRAARARRHAGACGRASSTVSTRGILNEVEAPLLPRNWSLPEGTLERFRARQITFSPGAPRAEQPRSATAERPLELLLGVTVLVLLIVCVNIANLLLARGASRAGEIAIRARSVRAAAGSSRNCSTDRSC